MKISISQGMSWRKILMERHQELVGLRNSNGNRERRLYGANIDKEVIVDPLYDVVALDSMVTRIAREISKLDEAIKTMNQNTIIDGYDRDDAVLGELQAAKPKDTLTPITG